MFHKSRQTLHLLRHLLCSVEVPTELRISDMVEELEIGKITKVGVFPQTLFIEFS